MHEIQSQRGQKVQTIVLWLAMLASIVVCASGSYEHVVIVPKWTEAPPASIAMFSGPYAIDTGQWWRNVHLPTFGLAIAALVLLRSDNRRRFVAASVLGYLFVLVMTVVWILPELVALTTDPLATIPQAEWKNRADRWEIVSLSRLALMYVNSLLLVLAAYTPSKSLGAA